MYVIFIGRMGCGVSRSLASARRRARKMAREEAGWYGTVRWRIVDEAGRIVADGIEAA
jgi:hypothetical protein